MIGKSVCQRDGEGEAVKIILRQDKINKEKKMKKNP